MFTVSEHRFRGDDDDPAFLSVSVHEVMKEEYGLYVWPCSVALAEYVWQQRHRFAGRVVVELGAGTGLPGIVAAKIGAQVTLTDSHKNPEVFDNLRKTCNTNDVSCQIQGLSWGEWDENIFDMQQPDIVLGADVLYDNKSFDDLFATVSFLLEKKAGSTFITTYECRSGHRSIEYLMNKWGLTCTKLVDVFDFLPPCKQSTISTSILLAEISRRSHDAS